MLAISQTHRHRDGLRFGSPAIGLASFERKARLILGVVQIFGLVFFEFCILRLLVANIRRSEQLLLAQIDRW
jgi:hypothetical protein